MDLYKKRIEKKYKKIKDIIFAKANLTQYNSIESLNFKLYFFDIYNLIFFNDNLEQNNEIENLFSKIRINNNNDNNNIINNLLLNNEMNIINEEKNEIDNLIEEEEIINNNDQINYSGFLNQIKQSYIDEYNSIFFQKFENVINRFFSSYITSQEVKQKLLKKVEKEIRNYPKVERENNISQNSDKFIQIFLKESLNNKNNNNINDDNMIEKEDENKDNQNNLSNINNLRMKSRAYKINNGSILKIEDIEHKVVIECIKFVSLYIMDVIKDYLLNDENIIKYLKNENNFIIQVRNNLDNL
jgi:hypothetical protein